MNIAAILSAVIIFIEALPKLIAAGADILETTQKFTAVLKKLRDENRDPTAEELESLHAALAADEKALQTDDAPPPADALAPVESETP